MAECIQLQCRSMCDATDGVPFEVRPLLNHYYLDLLVEPMRVVEIVALVELFVASRAFVRMCVC